MARKTKAQFEALMVTGYVITQQDIADILDSVHPGYKEYKAKLTQSGTSAPVATELVNGLGTVTPAYDSVGNFHLTGTGLFTGVVDVIIGGVNGFAYTTITDANTISIVTKNTAGTAANALLSATTITIRVWD